jgi:DUF2911 family protein
MKKLIQNITIVVLLFTVSYTFAQIDMPRPSPGSKVTQILGLTDIEVNYFRPKKKGRDIFGEGEKYLIPFGEIWRTGANSGTRISFSDNITFGGAEINAGEYMVFTVPGEDSWDVMLYSDLNLGGNVAGYTKDNEVVRVKGEVVKLGNTVETLTINIADISEDNKTANFEIAWENTAVKVSLATDYDAKIMASIEKNTKVDPANYIAAANYYFSTERDLDQALEWVNIYLKTSPDEFWNVHLKAQILAKKGDKQAAVEAAQKSLEMAKTYPQGDFGYIKRNEELIASLK